MANSTISTNNQVINFQREVFKEYVSTGEFEKFTGTSSDAIIQINKDLQKHSIPLIAKLKGSGVRGSGVLNGNEEVLANYEMRFQPTYHRNAVSITNEENEKSQFDLFQESRPQLMQWCLEQKRDKMIQALLAVEAGGTYYNYGGNEATGATGSSAASVANLDIWQANNSDRILYGKAKANLTSGDHTASLGTIDTTNDKLTTSNLSLLKRMANTANPKIRPIRVQGDKSFFVYFVGSYGFRDLSNEAAMLNANRDARARGENNPLFQGGDLLWDGILIREVPEMDKFIDGTGDGIFDGIWGANAAGDRLDNSGNSGSRVGVGFLCGAQSVVFGLGREAQFKSKNEDDYGHSNGVAVSTKHDIKKVFFNNKQHGIVTHFHSASIDS